MIQLQQTGGESGLQSAYIGMHIKFMTAIKSLGQKFMAIYTDSELIDGTLELCL